MFSYTIRSDFINSLLNIQKLERKWEIYDVVTNCIMGIKMSGFREFNSVPGPASPLGILSKGFYELSINDKTYNELSKTFYYIYIL